MLVFFLLPDTMKKGVAAVKRDVCSMFQPLKLLFFPPVIFPACATGIMFSCMYLTLFLLPLELSRQYQLSEIELGLCFLPFGVCLCLGTVVGGKLADVLYRKLGNGARLIPGLFCLILVNVGLGLFAVFARSNFWLCK